ncbi:MAG: hypothetical protein PHQ42_03755 [Patescibacteria group bacterium]|nr:hypothetical protein [Patescibacteria group bacterium]
MPNHIHLIMKITDKSPELSILIMNAKRFLTYGIIELLKSEGRYDLISIFQIGARKELGAYHRVFTDRYDSLLLQSQKLFLEKLNYIHNNPCQPHWNLAIEPEDYKHSSATNYILGKGYYDVDVIDF